MQHERGGVVYATTWQTWEIVTNNIDASTLDEASTATTPRDVTASSTRTTLREQIQVERVGIAPNALRERIEQRLSIDALSQRIGCDADALAAFERGDGVLTDAILVRMRRVLRIE